MTTFVIPLTNVPQSFEIALAGINYQITSYWNNAPDAGWVIDIANADTSVVIIAGLPLTTGANLLESLDYLGINGELWVYTDGDELAVPTFDNLGVECNLYFLTDAVG